MIITEDDAHIDDHDTVKTNMQGNEEDQVSKSDKEYLADIEGDGGYDIDATELVDTLAEEGMDV